MRGGERERERWGGKTHARESEKQSEIAQRESDLERDGERSRGEMEKVRVGARQKGCEVWEYVH